MSTQRKIIVGKIIHCVSPYSLAIIPNGFIIVDDNGKILAIGNASELESTQKKLNIYDEILELKKSQLLLPGFVDTHIHAPQYPNAGLGYDKPLLEWLDKYTYKLERQYRDPKLSQTVYDAVVRKTLDHGTTTACYFGSLFAESSLILAECMTKHGQRGFAGKINMIRMAPDDYIETPDESIRNTLNFIEDVKSLENPLVQPIITPRFAVSADLEHLTKLGEIAKEHNLNIQTHISENVDEVQLVRDLFKDNYSNVYKKSNLLTSKTVLAHGIHLSDEELKLLSNSGTSIAHCPESNLYLKSGICNVLKLRQHGINVGLGTDISGGASPSIINAMRAAIGSSINLTFCKENYTSLTYADAFYLATLGGAKALALDDQIGNFEVGKSFDAIIVDLDVQHSNVDYLLKCSPEELLQKLVFLGDDRNVVGVYVNGKVVK